MLALVASIHVSNAALHQPNVRVGINLADADGETKRPAADVRYGPRNEPTAMSWTGARTSGVKRSAHGRLQRRWRAVERSRHRRNT